MPWDRDDATTLGQPLAWQHTLHGHPSSGGPCSHPPALQDPSATEPGSIRFGFNPQFSSTVTALPLPRESIGEKFSGIKISELVKPLWQRPTPVSPLHAKQGGISTLASQVFTFWIFTVEGKNPSERHLQMEIPGPCRAEPTRRANPTPKPWFWSPNHSQCLSFPSEQQQHPPKIPKFRQRPSEGTKRICLSTPCETSQCPKG